MKRWKPFFLLLLLLTGGCGKVNPRPAFADLSEKVATRSGVRPAWARTAEETAALEQRVAQLLAQELTVETAVEIAVINNRALQASLEELAVAQADLAQAGLLRNPHLGLSVRFPGGPPSATNLEFGLGIELLDFLVLPARKKIALAEFESIRLRLAADLLDFIAEAKTAAYTLQAQNQLVDRLELVQEINATAAEFAREQHQAGTIGDLDLANHEAVYQQSRIELARARLQARGYRERLNRLMGLWGEQTNWSASGRLPNLPDPEIPLADLESLAIRQRLDLEAARWNVNLLGQALALKRKTRFFPVGLEIGVDTERETEGQWVTGPTLSLQIPIFDTGKASVARLQAQLLQVQRLREAMAVDARSRVREARDLMTAARDLTEFYERTILPQRVRIVDLTLRQYNMMLKGAYDLLAAKQNEVADERAHIEAWRDYWIARVELERALGGRLPGQTAPAFDRPRPDPTLEPPAAALPERRQP